MERVLTFHSRSKPVNYHRHNDVIKNAAVLLSLLLMQAVWLPPVQALEGDVTGNNVVDLEDLEIMTYWWLVSSCDIVDDCEGADMAGPDGGSEGGTEDGPDGIVNMYDFVLLAAHWLEREL